MSGCVILTAAVLNEYTKTGPEPLEGAWQCEGLVVSFCAMELFSEKHKKYTVLPYLQSGRERRRRRKNIRANI